MFSKLSQIFEHDCDGHAAVSAHRQRFKSRFLDWIDARRLSQCSNDRAEIARKLSFPAYGVNPVFERCRDEFGERPYALDPRIT